MTRRILAVITLAALFNLTLGGCSKVVKINPEEIEIDTPKRITGVVLKSGKEVTFDSTGGDYNPAHRRISGESLDGTYLVEPLSKLDIVKAVDLAEDSLSSFSLRARNLHEYLRPKQNEKIISVITKQSIEHKFWSGCRIDPVNNAVFGLTTRDSTLRIPIDSVAFFGVKKRDWVRTTIFISLYLASCVAFWCLDDDEWFGFEFEN